VVHETMSLDHIERALAAVEQGLEHQAYELLLDAWEDSPAEELEEALSLLTRRLGEGAPLLHNHSDLLFELERPNGVRFVTQLAACLELGGQSFPWTLVRHCFKHARDPTLAVPLLHLAVQTAVERPVDTVTVCSVIARLRSGRALALLEAESRLPPALESLRGDLRTRRAQLIPLTCEAQRGVEQLVARLKSPERADPERTAELFEAVYRSPGDDEPRLILADWLTEHGDPLGEFIALQCSGASTAERDLRADELLHQHRFRWSQALGEVPPDAVRFERGFPSRVNLVFERRTSRESNTCAVAPSLFLRPPSQAWATVTRMELQVASWDAVPGEVSAWMALVEKLQVLKAPAALLAAVG